jgi:3'-phosphoadenosine 5'-phosphosulfate sulfotransferase
MNRQGNTEKTEQCWRYHNTDFKFYYKAIAIKTAWYWHKNRYENQWNKIEDLNMSTHSYAYLILDKGAKKHMMEIKETLRQMLLGKVAICLQKIEIRCMPITLYYSQLKVDQGP